MPTGIAGGGGTPDCGAEGTVTLGKGGGAGMFPVLILRCSLSSSALILTGISCTLS